MATTQVRTAAKTKVASRSTRNAQVFDWVNTAAAKKIGLEVVDGRYFLGDMKLTAANYPVILNQLKALGRIIGAGRSVH